jgi:hypothetical protein
MRTGFLSGISDMPVGWLGDVGIGRSGQVAANSGKTTREMVLNLARYLPIQLLTDIENCTAHPIPSPT